MEIYVLILAVASVRTGVIFCHENQAEISTADHVDLIHRLEDFDRRETERELERHLWKQQLDDTQTKLIDILNENKQLKDDIHELKDRIAEIENDNEEIKKELINIKTNNHVSEENAINPNNEIKSDIRQILEGLNKRTESDAASPMKVSHVRNARNGRSVHRIRRAENEVVVAFYVALSSHLLHAGANQSIAFDQIFTNVGNAYNSHAGDFRAPVSGTYVFSTSLMAYGTHTTHYYFARNGVNVGKLYVRGSESPNSTSSKTIVIQLNAGDDVAVRNVDPDESLNGYSYCSFSGFLLQQDYNIPAGNVIG